MRKWDLILVQLFVKKKKRRFPWLYQRDRPHFWCLVALPSVRQICRVSRGLWVHVPPMDGGSWRAAVHGVTKSRVGLVTEHHGNNRASLSLQNKGQATCTFLGENPGGIDTRPPPTPRPCHKSHRGFLSPLLKKESVNCQSFHM